MGRFLKRDEGEGIIVLEGNWGNVVGKGMWGAGLGGSGGLGIVKRARWRVHIVHMA